MQESGFPTRRASRPGWLRLCRLTADECVVLGLVMLLLSALLPPLPGSVLIIGLMVLAARLRVVALGQTRRGWWRRYGRVTIIPTGFSVLGALTVALSLRIDPVFGFGLTNLTGAGELLIRSLAGVVCLGFLMVSLSLGELVATLRRWGMPEVFVELTASTARFGLMLIDTARSMRISQLARGGYDSSARARRSTAMLVATLFVVAIERARRLEIGLAARAGEGAMLTATPRTDNSPFRLLTIAGLALAVITLTWILQAEGAVWP